LEGRMTSPAWLAQLLAAVMLLIAVGSVARLALWRLRGRPTEPEADAIHAVMGVAMAGMLEPHLGVVPDSVWLAVFAAAGAWFAIRAVGALSRRREAVRGAMRGATGRSAWRCAHPAPHAVECAAMLYMLAPARATGHAPRMAMAGMISAAPTANPALAVLLTLFMLGYIVWTADRLTSQSRPRSARADSAAPAPRTAAWSKIAMSLAMGYMLLMTL
jgi:hypothetical protein